MSKNAITKILFKGTMTTTHATDLVKKMLRGCHFEVRTFLNFTLCSWFHLVMHKWKDPVCERVALACWSRINYGFASAEATIASSDIRLFNVRSEKETMEEKLNERKGEWAAM